MPSIALVTADAAVDLDEDLPPLLAAFAELEAEMGAGRGEGLEVATPSWHDVAVDWAAFDVVVVRSTWDYHERHEEFCAWADRVHASTHLCNPAPVIRWNTDKRYLSELAAAGIPVVPTVFVAPGDPLDASALDGLLDEIASPEVVVKPTVSAGSRDTARYDLTAPGASASAGDHVRALVDAGRVAMVQPYLAAVDHAGETAVICIDGAVSHAIRKGPLLRPGEAPTRGLFAEEHISAREPSTGEVAAARATLDVCADRLGADALLYARVDLIPGPDGAPVLLELELTEPSLFLDTAPGAAARFAAAVLRRARR